MKLLKVQVAARREPSQRNQEKLAETLRVMIEGLSLRILRDLRGTKELREELISVGFEAAWESLGDILTSYYDDERDFVWHVQRIAEPPMVVARDGHYKPAGVGHDRRREIARERDQNERQQEAGHRLPEAFRRAGGGVEHRSSLNGNEAYNGPCDDVVSDAERRTRAAQRELWARWFAAEVEDALHDEPRWLSRAVELVMKDRRFGIGDRRRPNVAAIARELKLEFGINRDALRAGFWRLACRVAADAPDYAEVDGTPLNPNKVGRRLLPNHWDRAAAEGEAMKLALLLFWAA
ncbi:hypothetical protein [Lacipirellula sp.]|uniref:hypothetical protein n=1 Tax=Lacipirellula sp. TaxID=2691419 RepID=UPI003D11C90A